MPGAASENNQQNKTSIGNISDQSQGNVEVSFYF